MGKNYSKLVHKHNQSDPGKCILNGTFN